MYMYVTLPDHTDSFVITNGTLLMTALYLIQPPNTCSSQVDQMQ